MHIIEPYDPRHVHPQNMTWQQQLLEQQKLAEFEAQRVEELRRQAEAKALLERMHGVRPGERR